MDEKYGMVTFAWLLCNVHDYSMIFFFNVPILHIISSKSVVRSSEMTRLRCSPKETVIQRQRVQIRAEMEAGDTLGPHVLDVHDLT